MNETENTARHIRAFALGKVRCRLIIHVVEPGESLYTIARQYGVTGESIAQANGLADPGQLVVGQSLAVPQGRRVYTVHAGDSLFSIARRFGVESADILRENPDLGDGTHIYPGQVVVIPPPQSGQGTIEVNGYAFPNTDENVLRAALPHLTYLSVFAYRVAADGSLTPIDDTRDITLARQNGVAPVMVAANIRESGGFSSEIAHGVLTGTAAQDALVQNILDTVRAKNYYAVNVDFEYIYPADREAYNSFLTRLTTVMHQNGYQVFTAVAPKLNADQQGLLYEAHDYPAHGRTVDRVILMTYEWGYLAGPPQAIAPIDQVRRVVQYAVSAIPPQKILLGIPNYAYDWTLPWQRGTLAETFSNTEAVVRARKNNAAIQFDRTAQSPFYNYYDAQGRQHIVWFEDARSVRAKLALVKEFGLAGVSYWTVGRPFPANWAVLSSTYNVRKVL